LFVSSPVFTLFAQTQTNNSGGGSMDTNNPQPGQVTAQLQNPLGSAVPDIPSLITKVINVVISFAYIVVACFLIWSGFKFVTAQGNSKEIESAKSTFYWTIVGALIVMGAQTLSAMFKTTLENLGK
jgi:heme/copper-type cytochrome/quinol oxidase subunit 2